MPVGYGDNPPVGPGTPEEAKGGPSPKPSANGAPGKASGDLPPAGPHDDPALTNPDSTPGTGALPPAGAGGDVDSTSS